jgi:alkylation response protein AidB-like acyl-CoA dehydrogenase
VGDGVSSPAAAVEEEPRLTTTCAGTDREPLFNLGSAVVALGICRVAVAGTASHLKSARFEHIGQSLGESLPTLRAQLATMQIDTDGLAARIDDLVDHLERPRDTTVLRVLETKSAAGDVAIAVTSAAIRVCGGAAFAKHMAIERLFRDAHAGAVMASTGKSLDAASVYRSPDAESVVTC